MAVNLLDVNYYRQTYSDLASLTDEQLVNHFFSTGLDENRSFSRLVDLSFYRAGNSDLASLSNTELYNHLANSGVQEGRRFSQFVDLGFYGLAYSDLASLNNEQRFEHLSSFGVNEGRVFSQFADLSFYRSANSDLASLSNIQIFEHLRDHGLSEGRRFSQFVNLDLYKLLNSDLTTLNNQALLEHLELSGLPEGRRFSYSFDASFYRNLYSDLSNGELTNEGLLEHFESSGLKENRIASDTFNASLYLANSSDLTQAGINTNSLALFHFELSGFKENRILSNTGFSLSQDPGDTLKTAADLGIILARRIASLNQQLGNSDRDDIYRFTLTNITNIAFAINSSDGVVNAQLVYDSNNNGLIEPNESIFSSDTGSTINFDKTLGIGSYYITVSTPRTDSSISYTLTPAATTIGITSSVDPGSTLSTALNLGIVDSTTRTLQDFVGIVDEGDLYRFTLNSISDVAIQINGLSGQDSVEAQLIYDKNNNGQIEVEYISSDASTSSISLIETLGIGTYYVRIQPSSSSSNTEYQMGISATTTANPPTTTIDPGDSVPTALNLGVLSGNLNFTDFVGTADRRDLYRFNIINSSETQRNVRFNIDSLTESAYAALIYDTNGNGQIESDDIFTDLGRSSSDIVSTQILADGTYFLIIDSSNFQSNSIYRLSLNLL